MVGRGRQVVEAAVAAVGPPAQFYSLSKRDVVAALLVGVVRTGTPPMQAVEQRYLLANYMTGHIGAMAQADAANTRAEFLLQVLHGIHQHFKLATTEVGDPVRLAIGRAITVSWTAPAPALGAPVNALPAGRQWEILIAMVAPVRANQGMPVVREWLSATLRFYFQQQPVLALPAAAAAYLAGDGVFAGAANAQADGYFIYSAYVSALFSRAAIQILVLF